MVPVEDPPPQLRRFESPEAAFEFWLNHQRDSDQVGAELPPNTNRHPHTSETNKQTSLHWQQLTQALTAFDRIRDPTTVQWAKML